MKAIFIMILGTFTFSIFAQDLDQYGIDKSSQSTIMALNVGEMAPNIKGIDQNSKPIELNSMLKDGPVVVIFYRGYWCGYCQKNLAEFQDEYSTLSSAGVQVVAIAPEVESNIDKTVAQNDLTFHVISDKTGDIMQDYKVGFNVNQNYQDKVIKYIGEDLNALNGQEQAVLPIPATYLIGQDGKIKFAHFDPDYSKRSSVKDIIANL